MRGDLFVGVADMATLLAERLASSSSAGRPSPVCCRHRDRWQTSFEKLLTEHMFSQTLRCYEGFRASAPRHAVHVCRQATQVSLAAGLLGQGLFGKLLQHHDESTLSPMQTTCMQTIRRQIPLRIECARVGGVEIPNQKRIEFSLQYIYGVGHTTAKAILVETVKLCMLHPCLAVHGLSFVLTPSHAGCKFHAMYTAAYGVCC